MINNLFILFSDEIMKLSLFYIFIFVIIVVIDSELYSESKRDKKIETNFGYLEM